MLNKKKAVFLLLLLLFLLVLLSACAEGGIRNATPTPLPAVVSYEKAVFTVERGSIVSSQDLRGEVVPVKQDELFFRASGFITRVAVKPGDILKKGDILAEQQVDELLNQIQQAEIDLQVAQAELERYNAERQYNIEKAKADVEIWERRVALSMLAVDETYGDYKVKAQLNLEIDEQNLLLAEKALAMINDEDIAYNEQSVKRAELSLDRLKGLLAERQITAPYDCIVLRSTVRPGQQTEAYLSAFVVGDPSELVIRTDVEPKLQDVLTSESEVHISLAKEDAQDYLSHFLPNFLPVSSENEEANLLRIPAKSYFYFQLPEGTDPDLFPVGRAVNVTAILGRKDDVLLLPPAAIREYRGLSFVIVQDGETRRRVEIDKIGLKAADRWEITADLHEGDQVLGP